MVRPSSLDIENIRLGGDNDGGYVVPNDFQGIKYCFSPGVGSISKFENDLTKKKIKCFLADYSVNPKFENNLIDFDKKFIGASSYENYLKMANYIPEVCDQILPGQNIDVVAYGCTSGTIAIGEKEITNQIRKSKPNTLVTTPITAALKAFKTLRKN